MKRYIINLMLAVAATACLTSCNDFLKEDPSSQIKEDEAYKKLWLKYHVSTSSTQPKKGYKIVSD